MKKQEHLLVYDGSFNGFLTGVYQAYEARMAVAGFRTRGEGQNALFAEPMRIATDIEKAQRVWSAIEKKQYQAAKRIYFAFLSERKGIECLLYRYIKALFTRQGPAVDGGFASLQLKLETLAGLVAQEKKQVEASVRFQPSAGAADVAMIRPRFNILPLVIKHFRSRQPHGNWILYDQKRNYGLFYRQNQMQMLRLSPEEASMLLRPAGLPYFTVSPAPRSGNRHRDSLAYQGNSAA